MSNTQAKHRRAMVAQDQHLAEVFKQPPLIAYKRQRNLKDILVKSKIPAPIERYPQTTLKEWLNVARHVLLAHMLKQGVK